MASDYRELSNKTINDAKVINNNLIEKALAIRCVSYLSQIKAQLLTDTIYEIDNSKKILFTINTKLEQEIHERKLAEEKLKKAKNEAEVATRLKDKFVALVSHDLKSPINVIMGYLQVLRTTPKLPDKTIVMIEKAISACDDMTTLVNEILNLSRIKGGGIKPECNFIDAEVIARSVVNDYALMASEKGVELRNEIPIKTLIYVDKKLLIEAISNIVSNAIKFCKKGDSIKIFLPHGELSTIAVVDTGIGIRPEFIDDLFQYEKKTSTQGTAGETGTGFGLPLTRDIIRAHGGDLQVKSTLGEGTTFYINIPYSS